MCIRDRNDPGTYTLTVSNECGSVTQSIDVLEEICACPVKFPSGFTPNNDGINDTFYAISICEFQSYRLRVIDRWGNKVFRSNDPNEAWDGTYKGEKANLGTYVFELKYRDQLGEEGYVQGAITLIR